MVSEELLILLYKLPIALIFLLVILRVMGNKELAQSSPMDVVFIMVMSSITFELSKDKEYTLFDILLIMIVISLIIFSIQWIVSRNNKARKMIEGKSKILIKDGIVNREVLKEERMSVIELQRTLREKEVFSIKDVKMAYLEPDGKISIKKKGSEKDG